MSVTSGMYLEGGGCASGIPKIDTERAIRNLDRGVGVQRIRQCACGTNARFLFGQRLIRWWNDVKVRVKQEVSRLVTIGAWQPDPLRRMRFFKIECTGQIARHRAPPRGDVGFLEQAGRATDARVDEADERGVIEDL